MMHWRFPFIYGAALQFLTLSVSAAPRARAPRGALDSVLVDRSHQAVVSGDMSRAVALLRGAREISPKAEVLQRLAQLHVMAGHFEDAVEQYEAVLKLNPPDNIADEARREIARLRSAPAPFTDQLFQQTPVKAEAELAFAQGAKLVRGKRLEEGIRYLRAALVMDPTLPGPYRLLGASYGKLKDAAREQSFLLDYLRVRPDGQLSDMVRARLRSAGVLGTLDATASFPCQVWVNGRPLQKTTPVKGLELPPGPLVVSFVSEPHHLIRNLRVKIVSKKVTRHDFGFGILVSKLDPWARIRASGRDLGLWDTVGLPAGQHDLLLMAHDGSRQKRISIKIVPGQTVSLTKW
jgi:hypothetical protein